MLHMLRVSDALPSIIQNAEYFDHGARECFSFVGTAAVCLEKPSRNQRSLTLHSYRMHGNYRATASCNKGHRHRAIYNCQIILNTMRHLIYIEVAINFKSLSVSQLYSDCVNT